MSTLISTDRCDRCGAQAYVRFLNTTLNLDMDFCRHHSNKYADLLENQGFTISVDERSLLEKPVGVS
jgi:hypothetical protein